MSAAILSTFGLIFTGLAGYVVTYRYHERFPRALNIMLWITSVTVALFWVLSHFAVLHVIRISFLVGVMTNFRMEYTAVFIGVFAALIQVRANKKRLPKGAFSRHNGVALTIFLMLPVYVNPVLFPMKTDFANEWKDGFCIQTTGHSCGPACVATLLKIHGINRTEEEVARKVYCSRMGVNMWDLGRYLIKNGLKVKVVSISHKPQDPPVPSIAGVGLGGKDGIGHAIIIMDKTDDTFTIVDPLCGRFEWTKEKTWDNYYFFGYLMHVTK